MFQSESDVRAWVRAGSGGKARWVEWARGGTEGLPDCWVPHCRVLVHMELKIATLTGGDIRYGIRPAQRSEIVRMISDRIPVGFLIGIKHTNLLVFAPPCRGSLQGLIRSDNPHLLFVEETGNFWDGVTHLHTTSNFPTTDGLPHS